MFMEKTLTCFRILETHHCSPQSHGVRLENNRTKSNDICREMRYNLLVVRDNKLTVQTSKSIVDTFKPFRNEQLNEPETTLNT